MMFEEIANRSTVKAKFMLKAKYFTKEVLKILKVWEKIEIQEKKNLEDFMELISDNTGISGSSDSHNQYGTHQVIQNDDEDHHHTTPLT
ncbi:CLUMA_CG010118, isoform A [Clunio marinus]|uniref:CLUMA_CG010118, isoform A n=1 Tax=Clunio marinus TaxID=568069 RepID=A0A1J1I8E5_9DIPT|nr:CLUMA_CG010118, isoform A [Clunio marinus]